LIVSVQMRKFDDEMMEGELGDWGWEVKVPELHEVFRQLSEGRCFCRLKFVTSSIIHKQVCDLQILQSSILQALILSG
jgi:hypothetical protein